MDAKARETAVTLVDVLRTSKSGAAVATNIHNANASALPIVTAIDRIVPTSYQVRHGFDTKGWDDSAAAPRPQSSHNGVATEAINYNTINQITTAINEEPGRPESETQGRSSQQIKSLCTFTVASSPTSNVPVTVDDGQEPRRRENRSQHEQQHEQQQCQRKNPLGSTKSNSETFVAESSSAMAITRVPPQIIMSMTSIGFGIDSNHRPGTDATNAAKKAVQDAMERSIFRFHAFHDQCLQIKVQLGVPAIVAPGQPEGSSSSAYNDCSKSNVQCMSVDKTKISSVLPSGVSVLSMHVNVGGLAVPGVGPSTPSICTVVACITLEPETQPSNSQKKLHAPTNTLVGSHVIPNRPVRSESSISTMGERASSGLPCNQPLQHNLPPAKSLSPSQMTKTKPNQNELSNSAQPRLNLTSKRTVETAIRNSTKTFPLPSPPVVYKGLATDNSVATGPAVDKSIANPPITTIGTTIPMNVDESDNNSQPQERHDEINQQTLSPVDNHNKTRAKNSIDLLAMISTQEIIRRESMTSTNPVSFQASHALATVNGDPREISIVVHNTGLSSEASDARHKTVCYKNGERLMAVEGNFATTRLMHLESFGYDRNGTLDSTQQGNRGHSREQTRTFIPIQTNTNNNSMGDSKVLNDGSTHLAHYQPIRQNSQLGVAHGGRRSILYADFSSEQPLPEERDCWALSTRTTSCPVFPLKLHETLTQIETDGYDDIVGWLPHGRSFKIFKQKEFTEIILPRYFVMTKKSSFLRQLNLYSFRRFSAGATDKGSYYHEKFLRGKKFLSRRMTRQKVNGNRIRSAGNPDEEPDLSKYPVCHESTIGTNVHSQLSSSMPTSQGTVGGDVVSSEGSLSTSPSQPSILT